VDLDVVAKHCEVVGGRQAGRASANDEDAVPGGLRGPGERPALFNGKVTEVALHGVNGHGTIEVGAVTGHFAGVVADTTVDGREGVVGGQLTPCLLFFVGLDEAQPLLNVFAGWAASITGRKHVEVYGSAGTGGSDAAGRAG
jgi:hypothetical protein